MSSQITTNLKTASDIIALSKSRQPAERNDSGTLRRASASGQALTLPEDVVTLSSQQTDSNPTPVRKLSSVPVTPSEKNALLVSETSSYRLSIYA